MTNLNPFIYGKPVPANRHINRNDALHTIFSRIQSKESTAIVGFPQVGKTSLIKYIVSDSTMKRWIKEDYATEIIIIEIDVYTGWLSLQKKPINFWSYIFDEIESKLEIDVLKDAIKAVRKNQYGSATLFNFFKKLGSCGKRVLLVIDEFDSLLYHKNFSNAEFFGSLRSIATGTDGLQLLTSSITSVEDMDEYSSTINPIGSPFFNNFTSVKLELFDKKAVNELIDSTLDGTGINFDQNDKEFVEMVSGYHPYRLQAICATLYDAKVMNISPIERYEYASKKFTEQTGHHFSQIWKRLDDKTKTVLVIMVVLHFKGVILGKEYNFGEIENTQHFGTELEKLCKLGFVEKVGKRSFVQWDWENFLLWREQKWHLCCEGIAWWLSTAIVSDSRDIQNFDAWLRNQEIIGYLLTRKQWETIKCWIKKAPEVLGGSIASLFTEFIKGLLKKKIEG